MGGTGSYYNSNSKDGQSRSNQETSLYIYSSDSDSVVAECVYTSKSAVMIAVSNITTSAVVAADLYIYTYIQLQLPQ